MTVALDTLAFAERFEAAGFQAGQARALASALGQAHDVTVETLVTKDHLDMRLAEMETRLTKQMAEMDGRWTKQMAEIDSRWTKQMTEMDGRWTRQIAEMDGRLTKQMADMDGRWTRQIAENGRDISARLWSTIAVISGVSTAVSATIGAGMVFLFRLKGM